jgi:hypothetical protein
MFDSDKYLQSGYAIDAGRCSEAVHEKGARNVTLLTQASTEP